jgi:hypothetical protein
VLQVREVNRRYRLGYLPRERTSVDSSEIRAKVDDIVQRLERDQEFRNQMDADPEATLVGAVLGRRRLSS